MLRGRLLLSEWTLSFLSIDVSLILEAFFVKASPSISWLVIYLYLSNICASSI